MCARRGKSMMLVSESARCGLIEGGAKPGMRSDSESSMVESRQMWLDSAWLRAGQKSLVGSGSSLVLGR